MRSPTLTGVLARASIHCEFVSLSKLRLTPTCPSTRSMRAAFGSPLAWAERSYLNQNAAVIPATTATPKAIKTPCGQSLILFIKPPEVSCSKLLGRVGRDRELNYDAIDDRDAACDLECQRIAIGLRENCTMREGQTRIPAITIRRASAEDAPAIVSLLYESFFEYRSLYTVEGFSATVISQPEVIDRIHDGPVFVVMTNATVVGTVAIVPKGESLYLRGMAVH